WSGMKVSWSWRSVVVPVVAVGVLAVPLVGVAAAEDHPYPPHSSGHPYPPKPPKPHEPDEGEWGHGDHEGHKPGKPHLADTGGDNTGELVLGGVAAALVAAGAGAAWAARRRRSS
ncbi:LPXTG cell wall anchor domain-containing protein, partial [Streptomyces sp. NPDC047971]|uniref:LPXTG cell wall anchor domain-containing protein n=1 Tax=Streptomyces sp. NPDC047971 TaxID=3154499 RepID=UPI0033CE1E36